MRELKYYVACTVDRFIAAEDGSFGAFLAEGEHYDDLHRDFPETFPAHYREAKGISAPNREFGLVLMGRRTYEVGASYGITNPYPHLEQYVISHSMRSDPDPAVTLVRDDATAFVRELKSRPGKDIWLCGGGELAAALFAEIDELILKVNPVLLGAGIPLFAAPVPQTPLRLAESRLYDNGFMRLRLRPVR